MYADMRTYYDHVAYMQMFLVNAQKKLSVLLQF